MPIALPNGNSRPTTADREVKNKDERAMMDESSAPAVQAPMTRTNTIQSTTSVDRPPKDLRKGVKAVSFITRLMGNKKKDEEVVQDDESIMEDGRPEGNAAEVFAQPVDNIGYSPRQPQPPAYIKVRSRYKKERDFDRVFLAQELECRKRRKVERQNSSNKLRRKSVAPPEGQNTVWAMEFSRDGKYLAAAGVDGVVRVWQVLSSSEDRQSHEKQEASENEANGADSHAEHLSAPVFQSQPVREYEGHTSTVLDLSWSKNNFLLSSSMDKTVRLWHVSRAECLCTFQHKDFVPSISFHPKDDRFFLAGSLDSRLRLWSIPDKSVAFTASVPDMITAVAFTPDGKFAMAGCLSGLCMFYETEGLKYQSQIHVRSSRGHNAKGSKITGIQACHDRRGDVKLLITSNDSRIRLYNFRDKSLEVKFRGNENNCSQIRASVSDDGAYVFCGSEDRKAYIWSMGPAEGEKRDKRPVEMFESHDTITTCVAFAPTKTRMLLGRSEDPVYDLCNPPPVTLMSRAERAESQSSSRPASRPASMAGSIQSTPTQFERFEKPKESASYLTRAKHTDGNIIVTADFTGKIKIFRQDCAWGKRRGSVVGGSGEDWDRASLFSKRGMSRSGSVATKASQRSLREGARNSISLQRGGSGGSTGLPSDRIIAWRQGIASSPSIIDGVRRRESRKGSGDGSRSISPRKSVDQTAGAGQSSIQQQRSQRGSDASKPTMQHPLAQETTSSARAAPDAAVNGSPRSSQPSNPSLGETGDEANANPLLIRENGQSDLFYDTVGWAGRAARAKQMSEFHRLEPVSSRTSAGDQLLDVHSGGGRPGLARGETGVSELSDERSERGGSGGGEGGGGQGHGKEGDGESEEFSDAPETPGEVWSPGRK